MLPELDLTSYIHQQNLTDLAVLDVRERMQRTKRAYDAYYYGGPETLKVRKGEVNDNVKINYARLIVDAGVANLFGGDVRISATADSADNVQTVITRCWTRTAAACSGRRWERAVLLAAPCSTGSCTTARASG